MREHSANQRNRKGERKMLQKISFSATMWLIILWVLFSACGGRQLEVESIPKTAHPQELINQLDNEIALARTHTRARPAHSRRGADSVAIRASAGGRVGGF